MGFFCISDFRREVVKQELLCLFYSQKQLRVFFEWKRLVRRKEKIKCLMLKTCIVNLKRDLASLGGTTRLILEDRVQPVGLMKSDSLLHS